jgi:hypothetical protein
MQMSIKNSTIFHLRLLFLVIGFFVAVTGLPFGFSNGKINLIPISGLAYANPLSGIVLGTLGILIVMAEVRNLCKYYNNFR